MATLSKKARAALPSNVFAGPGRSFPVNDAAHAKAAIMDSKYAPDPAAIRARAKAALAKMGGKKKRSKKNEEAGETAPDNEKNGG